MSDKHIRVDYFPGDKALILGVDTWGIVRCVTMNTSGVLYDVSYWINGEQKTVTLWPCELSKVDGRGRTEE